jgi:hypothetical protein
MSKPSDNFIDVCSDFLNFESTDTRRLDLDIVFLNTGNVKATPGEIHGHFEDIFHLRNNENK